MAGSLLVEPMRVGPNTEAMESMGILFLPALSTILWKEEREDEGKGKKYLNKGLENSS